MWRWVVIVKYGGERGGWYSKLVQGAHGCGLWKSIRILVDRFVQCIQFEVGCGSRIRFWHDCWCGDQPWKMTFPLLFETVVDNDAYVEFLLERSEVLGLVIPKKF